MSMNVWLRVCIILKIADRRRFVRAADLPVAAATRYLGPMPYYRYHVFFCTNLREDGRDCCQRFDASALRDYAKQRSKQLGLAGKGGVRINTAGCLDRCAEGPVLVVYPEGVWYTYLDQSDIDEILTEHLQHGRIVQRLLLPASVD
jgi:(2Fe-2S) ferredoxin